MIIASNFYFMLNKIYSSIDLYYEWRGQFSCIWRLH